MSKNNRNLYRYIIFFVIVIGMFFFPRDSFALSQCTYAADDVGSIIISIENGQIKAQITGIDDNRIQIGGGFTTIPTDANGNLVCPETIQYAEIAKTISNTNGGTSFGIVPSGNDDTSLKELFSDCNSLGITCSFVDANTKFKTARSICTTEQTATFSRIVTEMSNNITSFSNSVNSSTVNTTELKNYSDRIIASYNEYQQARSNALECAKASWDDTVDELWNELEQATSTLMNKELTGQDKTAAQEIVNNLRGAVGNLGEEVEVDCSTYQSVLDIVSEIFGWIQIAAPILLILFGSIDFGKAVISNDQDALKKATSDFVKRAIAAVAIFFLPLIINLIFQLPGVAELFEDAFCEIKV